MTQANETRAIRDEYGDITNYGKKLILRGFLLGLLLIVILCTGCAGFFTVKSTERAVVSQWGAVNRVA